MIVKFFLFFWRIIGLETMLHFKLASDEWLKVTIIGQIRIMGMTKP